MSASGRGQTELIGTVLLAAVVLLSAALIGFMLLDRQADRIDRTPPDAEFRSDFGTATLNLTHTGGDSFRLRDLDIVLRSDAGESRYDLDAVTIPNSDGDEFFDSGETAQVSHSVSGEARILLVDTSQNGFLLYDETKSNDADGGGGNAQAPTITTFEVTDVSTTSETRYEVDWRATDDEGDITSVDVELVSDDDGTVLDSETTSFGEVADTGTVITTLSSSGGIGDVYEITVTATDATGNTASVKELDRSDVDTTPPVISNFEATNPLTDTINVSFESDEELGDINVTIDKNKKRVVTLTEVDFDEDKSGNYTYVASYLEQQGGTYNATLNTANDTSGNDGADGEFDTVKLGGQTATPTPTPTPTDDPPSASIDDVVDNTQSGCNNCDAEYEVDWSASDDLGISSVTVELVEIKKNNNKVADTATPAASGTSASGTVTLTANNGNGNDYEIRLTVEDSSGQTATDTVADTADGSDPTV